MGAGAQAAPRAADRRSQRRRRGQPEPISLDSDIADVVADRVDRATVHEVLGRLHWRERRELLLYAHGFSYQKIAQLTGTSYTAVNRWIVRGKNALRAEGARRELSGDTHCPPR